MKKTLVLVILDGWGVGRKEQSNPIWTGKPANINYIRRHYPSGTLQASGIAVGLPWNEEGNSEVGHLTIGAGKTIYQHYPRISLAIRDGSFFENKVLLKTIEGVLAKNSALNLVGLLTEGNVHASFEHFLALISLAKNRGVKKTNLHLFTDGRDGSAEAALNLIRTIGEKYGDLAGLKIASLSGRYFAMNRDGDLKRTEEAFKVIVGEKEPVPLDPVAYLKSLYARGLTDETITPALFDSALAVKPDDGLIFFNFREDGMRQLVQMFIDRPIAGLSVATFTKYSGKFDLPVAFPAEEVVNPLGKVISDHGLVQLRLAETEKYAHITYFFNGLREEPFKNEYRVLIPSLGLANPADEPKMRAREITTRAVFALTEEGAYDFILINYANPDIIAHTGDYKATLEAVKVVDEEIGNLMKTVLDRGGTLVITADHGNAEVMVDPLTGLPETKHNTSPVPIYIVAKGLEREKSEAEVAESEEEAAGVLADVAPTVLKLMGLPQPAEMTGVDILPELR
ncbi:MAG TPA: 2,3-bisphosphoglycerate-independent phosphoglycerate mutase [Candidatus Tyrphobacter sp.]|nr:2,3-bisphosphoglycerate-independent phosphoglycerate mutase [Candidatus Tyrphobacter sp.]